MSTATVNPAVLIVGAGPAGLALAVLLAQNNVPVRIIDREPAPLTAQRGPGIQPRSLELYSIAGLDTIQQSCLKLPSVRVYGPGGIEPMTEFNMFPPMEPTPDSPIMAPGMLGQGRHTELLREALAQHGVAVEWGTQLTELTQDADGVDVAITKRSGAHAERARFQWVVGADGAKSTVRKLLEIAFLGDTKEGQAIFGDLVMEGLGEDYLHIWHGGLNISLLLRPTEVPGTFQLVIGGEDPGSDRAHLAADSDALISYVHRVIERKDVRVVRVISSTAWTPNICMASEFSKGRVFLLGDAAHIHSPTGAQGMNSGIQDAFNLAWKLAFVHKGLSPASLLETYDEERRPVIAHMLKITSEIMETVRATGSLEYGNTALFMLGINYRSSTLAGSGKGTDETASPYYAADGQLRAGDRAPQAPALRVVKSSAAGIVEGAQTSLFKLLKVDRYTALVFAAHDGSLDVASLFAGAPADVVRKAVILPQGATGADGVQGADVVVVDEGGHAYGTYGIAKGEERIVIVRPDAYIGALVKDRSSAKLGGVFAW